MAPPQHMQVHPAADGVVLGGDFDAVMEVQGLPKFVPGGVVNEAGATKWYTEVSWIHKEGGRSREYICKLPVAIKESRNDQHNAPVALVNDACCGFGVTTWTRKLHGGGRPGRKARWRTCSNRWRCRTSASGGGDERRASAESLQLDAPCQTSWRQRRRPV